MLSGMVPDLSRVAELANPANASSMTTVLKPLRSTAQAKGITTRSVEARTPQEIE